jgi:hypothetical protein
MISGYVDTNPNIPHARCTHSEVELRNIESNTDKSARQGNLRHPGLRFQSFADEAREKVQDREISEKKNQTPVRGQDGKISDTRRKDFYWSPTRPSLVGDQNSFPWVSEIFPSCPLTGVRSFISH